MQGDVTCLLDNTSVGGLVALPVSSSGSQFPPLPLAAVAATALALLATGIWYGRRRWLR